MTTIIIHRTLKLTHAVLILVVILIIIRLAWLSVTKQHRTATEIERRASLSAYVKNQTYHPIRDINYTVDGANNDRAVFVMPRRVYYDNRLIPSTGERTNAVVILAEVHDKAVKTILDCEVNGHYAQYIRIFKRNAGWVRKNFPGHTHLAMVVQCLGLPKDAIFNGSIAKLIYKKKEESFYSRVQSEMPLLLLGNEDNAERPTRGKGSVVACTTTFGTPDLFDEWVKYHKYLGVERVHVNAESSFAEKASQVYSFFNESLSNGFATMEVWNNFTGNRSFYHIQFLKYQDCLYRHIGVFEYGLFYDYDDFFNPLLRNKTDIHYYIERFFSGSDIGSVLIPWNTMECKPQKKLLKDVPHGNLTSILSGYATSERWEGKSIHKLIAHVMVHIHWIKIMRPGFRQVKLGRDLAYIAHNRVSAVMC